MSKKNQDKDIKEIKIDYIETPRGRVPTIETIKNLISTWNDLLSLMNENLMKISELFGELKEALTKIDLSLNKLDSKMDNVSRSILEIKSISKEINSNISAIKQRTEFTSEKHDELTKEKAKQTLKEMFE